MIKLDTTTVLDSPEVSGAAALPPEEDATTLRGIQDEPEPPAKEE